MLEEDTLNETVVDNSDLRVSYHARLRFLQRINRWERLSNGVVENSKKITLPYGYTKGLWNKDADALFLVKGHTISTVIPSDINQTPLTEDEVETCEECDSLYHEDWEGSYCKWCGSQIEESIDEDSLTDPAIT